MLKFLCLLVFLMTNFKSLYSQEIITITETAFCYNSSLKSKYELNISCNKELYVLRLVRKWFKNSSLLQNSIIVFLVSLWHYLLGFRLNAPVLEVHNVSWKSACVDNCFAHPCCRSMNYNYASLVNQSGKCELLHDLVENTSYVLEPNSSFDHLFFNYPLKVIRTLFNFSKNF